MIYFGWDISTSFIGCCCMDDTGEVLLIEVSDLTKVQGGLHAKFIPAERGVADFIERARRLGGPEDEVHGIERRLKNMVGKTNKDTLLALAAMNAVVTHVIIKECAEEHRAVRHLDPSSVKRIVGLKVPKGGDKKTLTVELVRRLYPDFPYRLNRGGVNPVDGTYDMADAYITALALRAPVEQAAEGIPPNKGARKARAGKARKV